MRRVPPSFFLVDIKKRFDETDDRLIEINEMGRIVWELLEEHKSVRNLSEQIYEMLENQKSVDLPEIESDVFAFLEMLRDLNYVYVD